MPESPPNYVFYKLTGPARDLARELIAAEKEVRDGYYPGKPEKFAKSMREININNRVVAELVEKKVPRAATALGLDKGMVQISEYKDGHARAYKHFPVLAESLSGGIFMYCPVDFRGRHHEPRCGTLVSEDEILVSDFGDVGHKTEGPLTLGYGARAEEGTSLPAIYDPSAHSYTRKGMTSGPGLGLKVFIAAGGSLGCVENYLTGKKQYREKLRALDDAVKAITGKLPQEKILGTSTGQKLSTSCFYDSGELWVSVTRHDKGAVIVKDNDFYNTVDYRNGMFRIEPNKTTPQGRELAALLERVKHEPKLDSFLLRNPTAPKNVQRQFNAHGSHDAAYPSLHSIRGVHYLVYEVEKNKTDYCQPAGGIPVRTAEFLWHLADEEDKARNVRPADPPPELMHLRPIHKGPA